MAGRVGAVWGVGGIVAMLVYAIVRIGGRAIDALSYDLAWYHWAVLILNIVFMAYSEGYRGFHKAFSPRVVARARHLACNPRPFHVLLAPLFCMGYFHATRRRLIGTYALTSMILLFVVIIRQLEQPWRGIIGAGVVVGLVWGTASILSFVVLALNGQQAEQHSPEVPASTG